MSFLRFAPLVLKYVVRHRTRSILTIAGVAAAMFLFQSVQAMRNGVRAATQRSAEDTTLVVYRQNRFCPFTSQLPEDYGRKIAEVHGVRSVVPVQVIVNNCRASLDIVTFRGVPENAFETSLFDGVRVTGGTIDDWKRRTDAALVGSRFAARRNLSVGDRLDAAGVQVHVAGILDSSAPQDLDVAYVHLPFLQRTASDRIGIVTQFNVHVDDPDHLDRVARDIDALFADMQAPTWTTSEKAFAARAIVDIAELVGFAQWLGWGSLAAVFALVANAIVLSVQDRTRDHAVMQTLGYGQRQIAGLIVAESVALSAIGGAIGLGAATLATTLGRFTFSVDGVGVAIQAGPAAIATGAVLCIATGVLAGLFPAFRAARMEIVACFRAV